MIIYDLLIRPIELLIQILFNMVFKTTESVVASIFSVGIVVSIITLPLYNRAEIIEKEERLKQEKLLYWKNRINKAFTGEERQFMLRAYYKEQGYNPLYALRSASVILIQIPFFVAAYHFLSHLEMMDGVSWGVLYNLGNPDEVIRIHQDLSINILPIIMTMINYVSGAVYSKNLKWREKWQIIILPAVFFVLLYSSPSGLVLYWIGNNLFSLFKNIIKESKYRNKIIYGLKIFSILCITLFIYIYVYNMLYYDMLKKFSKNILYNSFAVWGIIIFIAGSIGFIYILAIKMRKEKNGHFINEFSKTIILEEIAVFLMVAILIPLSTIAVSPMEFSLSVKSLFTDVLYRPILTHFGVIFLWLNVVVWLMPNKEAVKRFLFFIVIVFIINAFLFGRNLGLINSSFIYEQDVSFSILEIVINFLICLAIFIVSWVIEDESLIYRIIVATLSGILCICIYYGFIINQSYSRRLSDAGERCEDVGKVYTLSRNGKNVIIIMLDRAIGRYVPFVMAERKDLLDSYDGFVYYPNTISMAGTTNMGAPELWGGYEYTPVEINKRADEKLIDKHNEALRVLPVLFQENSYDIYLTDLPYANYSWVSDMSIFDEYPGINTGVLEEKYDYLIGTEGDLDYNTIVYSSFRVAPVLMKNIIYDDGRYLNIRRGTNLAHSKFFVWRKALSQLPVLRNIEESGNNFVEICNNMTHEPCDLQLPDYEFKEVIDNSDYGFEIVRSINGITMNLGEDTSHYMTNTSALILLGKWFDYLREQGVYDNTRIIIVSDHGRGLGQFEDMIIDDELDIEAYNCLLLYKDFYHHGWLTSNEFMTNADVPTLATHGIIENPKNPFTGNVINSNTKYEGGVCITLSDKFSTQDAYIFDTAGDPWYSVSDDIFDKDKWSVISVE